jgi:hypothetical protein
MCQVPEAMADEAASGWPGSLARPSKTVLLEPLILTEVGPCDMDAEGWYSAHHRSHRRHAGCPRSAVVQGFTGVGGDSIQFAAVHAQLRSCHFLLQVIGYCSLRFSL